MTKKSNQNNLKPCPFCGNTDLIIVDGSSVRPNFRNVSCFKCGADWVNQDAGNFDGWNSRLIEDAQNEQIAELKAKLESVLEVNLKFRSVCYHLLTEGGEKLHDVLVAWKALEDSEDGGKAVKDWYQKHRDVLGNESESDGNE